MATQTTGFSGIADRYVAALYELAEEQCVVDEVAENLSRVAEFIQNTVSLRRLVDSPVFTRKEQEAGFLAVVKGIGLNSLTMRFVAVLAFHRRLVILPLVVKQFLARRAAKQGLVIAEVAVAIPLTQRQTKDLQHSLELVFAAKVVINVSVEPGLIGGITVKIGSQFFDSSIRSKLRRLSLALTGVV